MAAALVATGTQVNAATTSLPVVYPAGFVAGNTLICVVTSNNSTTETITTPAGWTAVQNDFFDHPGVAIFTKTSDGSEVGFLTIATSAATCTWHGVMVAFSGLRTSGYVWDAVGAATTASTAVLTSSSLTFNTNAGASSRRLALIVAQANSTAVTYSAETLSGLTGVAITELVDANGQLVAFGTATGGTSSAVGGTISATVGLTTFVYDLIEDIAPSAPSIATPVTMDPSLPSLPSQFSWTSADADDGPGASYGYDVNFSSDGGTTWPIVVHSGSTDQFYIAPALTLTPGTWKYRVRTYDYAGQVGPYTTSGSFTVIVPTPPNTPTVLCTANNSDGSITVVATTLPVNFLLESQSSFETGHMLPFSNCTPTQSTTFALDGTHSMQMASIAAGTMVAQANAGSTTVTVGRQYTAVARFRAAVSPRLCSVSIEWVNAALTVISTSVGTAVSDTTTGWTQVFVTDVAPALAVTTVVLVTVASTGGASELHYVDEVDLHAGSLLVPFVPAGVPVVTGIDIYRRFWNDGSAGIRIAAGITPGVLLTAYTDYRPASGTAYQYRAVARTAVPSVVAASAWSPA